MIICSILKYYEIANLLWYYGDILRIREMLKYAFSPGKRTMSTIVSFLNQNNM